MLAGPGRGCQVQGRVTRASPSCSVITDPALSCSLDAQPWTEPGPQAAWPPCSSALTQKGHREHAAAHATPRKGGLTEPGGRASGSGPTQPFPGPRSRPRPCPRLTRVYEGSSPATCPPRQAPVCACSSFLWVTRANPSQTAYPAPGQPGRGLRVRTSFTM